MAANTHGAAPRMEGSNCCIETLAIGATAGYALVELVKFVLNKAWYFTKESGYTFKDISVATLHQVSQINIGTQTALEEMSRAVSEVAFPSIAATKECIKGSCQVGVQSLNAAPAALSESSRLLLAIVAPGVKAALEEADANLHTFGQQLVALPKALDETMRLPSESAKILMNFFSESTQNMAHGAVAIPTLLSNALYKIKTTFWEMAGGSIQAFQEGMRSICMTFAQLEAPFTGAAYEARQTIQDCVLSFVSAAIETLSFTGHELQQFVEALPSEIREFFALPKAALLEVACALMDQLIASEMFIYEGYVESGRAFKEVGQVLRETVSGIVQEMGRIAINSGHGVDQVLAGGAKTCQEIVVPLSEITTAVIKAELESLVSVSQGSVQASIGAARALQEVGLEVQQAGLMAIQLVADSLLNSSQACQGFVPALCQSIKEGARIPVEVIEASVNQIGEELQSKGIAVRQGGPFVLNSIGEVVQIPRETVEEVVRILADHLLASYNGARSLDRALREDLSDTFQILVADPFAKYALPIIYFVGRHLKQAREASAVRFALLTSATARRWSEIKTSVSTRMEQIRAAIARRS